MHFGLTEEQKLLQHSLRELCAGELPPNRLRELFDEGNGFDAQLWNSTAEMGLAGLIIPEAHGGAGLELLDLALATEVLGEASMPGPFLGHSLASIAIARGGSDAQQAKWLPRLATGEAIGTVALGEAGDVWDPQRWQTKESGGALHGAKRYVEAGERADLIVVGTAGGGLAVVEAGAGGITPGAVDALDRSRTVCNLDFDGTRAEALTADPAAADAVCDAARVLLAADALGAAWKLVTLTAEYALQREQFDTRIAQFQSVKHQIANLAAECEPMRGLVWYAAYAFDHLAAERAEDAANAKAHVTDRAVDIARMAVELHGGIGFTWECDVQFFVKRAMFDRSWLGAPRAHRERLATLKGW